MPEHKKRLLRIALKEIIATCEGETIRLVLHWQGGDHTQVEFQKIRTGRHRYVTDDDLVEIVRKLARIEPDARIASILNRNQRRTAHGQDWTAKRVCSLRNNHAIPVYREGERQARGEMSVSECCRRPRRHADHCFAVDSAETVAGDAGLCERALDSAQSGRRAMRGRTESSSDPTNGRFSAIDP